MVATSAIMHVVERSAVTKLHVLHSMTVHMHLVAKNTWHVPVPAQLAVAHGRGLRQ